MIWQRGMDIVDLVYEFVKELPQTEKFNLANQCIKCSCSIPANIAEGSGKQTKKAFLNFLGIALSSSFELETHLLICQRRSYGNKELLDSLLDKVREEQKMIIGYQDKLEVDNS